MGKLLEQFSCFNRTPFGKRLHLGSLSVFVGNRTELNPVFDEY